MGKTILYGVNENNELSKIHSNNNGMASCFPVWNYLNDKYFSDKVIPPFEMPCWNLTTKELSKEEYFMLLSTFDGYYFTRENLVKMVELLKATHLRNIEPVKSTRLEFFEFALKNTEYDVFFITATTVADYSKFIDDGYDYELEEYTSNPKLKDTVWNIWDEFMEEIGEEE